MSEETLLKTIIENKESDEEEFIFGLNSNNEIVQKIDSDTYFFIIKDTTTNKYEFHILEDFFNIDLLKLLKKVHDYIFKNKTKFSKHFDINEMIYDNTGVLCSANTLEELYSKLEFVCYSGISYQERKILKEIIEREKNIIDDILHSEIF